MPTTFDLDTLSDDELREWKAQLDQLPPAPWSYCGEPNRMCSCGQITSKPVSDVIDGPLILVSSTLKEDLEADGHWPEPMWEAIVKHIAGSPIRERRLIAEVKRLREAHDILASLGYCDGNALDVVLEASNSKLDEFYHWFNHYVSITGEGRAQVHNKITSLRKSPKPLDEAARKSHNIDKIALKAVRGHREDLERTLERGRLLRTEKDAEIEAEKHAHDEAMINIGKMKAQLTAANERADELEGMIKELLDSQPTRIKGDPVDLCPFCYDPIYNHDGECGNVSCPRVVALAILTEPNLKPDETGEGEGDQS